MTDEYKRGMADAAAIAKFYAVENYRLANDTVSASPLFRDHDTSPGAMRREAMLADQGGMYAARANCAEDIYNAIKSAILAREIQPRQLTCVVVPSSHYVAPIKQAFLNAFVVPIGGAVMGHRFTHVVIFGRDAEKAFDERDQEPNCVSSEWFNHLLLTKLTPDAIVIFG